MAKYVVTEVYVKHTVVEARSVEHAYDKSEPEADSIPEGFQLSNWHVAAIGEKDRKTGGLNYRQVHDSDSVVGQPPVSGRG